MPCGCQNACGCNVVGDNVTASVVRTGDKFTVSSIPVISGVADTDCVDLAIDEYKVLRAFVLTADAGDTATSVQLECGPTGLEGMVVVDPASQAPIYNTVDGLRVDLPQPAPSAESASPGTIKMTASIRTEAGWLDADGSEVSRLTYPDLHDAVSLISEDADREAGSPTVTNLDVGATRFLAVGMPAEVEGFPGGLIVTAVGGSSITFNQNAMSNGAGDTTVRVYPWGNGDGGGTFNLPDYSDLFAKGMDDGEGLGRVGGDHTVELEIENMPRHQHPGSDVHPGSANVTADVTPAATGITVDAEAAPAHYHEAGTDRASHFVTVEEPVVAADYVAVPTVAGINQNAAFTIDDAISLPSHASTDPGIINYAQGDRLATSNDGAHDHVMTVTDPTHDHTVTASDSGHDHGITVAWEGNDVPHENRPRFRTTRYLVKT